jgi:dTDP-4-dehydrorhamnose reductase
MSRVLILGAGGMLGHKACHLLSGSGHDVIGTVRGKRERRRNAEWAFENVRIVDQLDVTEDDRLRETVRQFKPDWIVNCVGIVKQRSEAIDKFRSVAINAYFPHRLVRMADEEGARVIHVSTDCVFSGEKGDYLDTDLSDALDIYGKSKYLGETDETEPNAVTLRTSIIGRELNRPAQGLLEWFISNRGGSVNGFLRAIFTGFTTIEMCRIFDLVINESDGLCGTWNVASSPISKYELLRLINRIYGLEIQVNEDTEFCCDRSLRMQGFAERTGYRAPSWEKMVQDMHDVDSRAGYAS